MARVTGDEKRAEGRPDEEAKLPQAERYGLAAHVEGLERDDDAAAQYREREQKVAEHEPGVEVVVDRDRSERCLPEGAHEDGAREHAEPGLRRREREGPDEGAERGEDRD